MQISYHFANKNSKITKLKKKKKNFFCTGRYCSKLAGMADTWPVRLVFKPVRNVDVLIPIYILVRYIPAGTASTSTILTTLGLGWFYFYLLLIGMSALLC